MENVDFREFHAFFFNKKSIIALKFSTAPKALVFVKKATESDIYFAFLLKLLVFSPKKVA